MPVKVLTVREPTEGAIEAYRAFVKAQDDKTGCDNPDIFSIEVTDAYGNKTEYRVRNHEEFVKLIEKAYPRWEFCGTLPLKIDADTHREYRLYLRPKQISK